MRYGFADFESAGVVKETQYLPENMWKMSDAEQFKWLDEQMHFEVEDATPSAYRKAFEWLGKDTENLVFKVEN